MKNSILFSILFLIIEISSAQPPDTLWSRVFYGGNDAEAYSVQLTSDGGYILAGRTRVNNLYMAFILKSDSMGNQLWDWRDDPAETHVSGFNSVKQTPDGNYIAMGSIVKRLGDRTQMYLCYFTGEGDTLWTRAWPDSGLYGFWEIGDVVALNDGFLVTGAGNRGLVRLDSQGNEVWTRDLGGEVKSVATLADGGFVCSGNQNETGGVFLVRTDANGDSQWFRYFGGGFDGHGNQLVQLADGGYAVCGYNAFIRTNSNGDALWQSQTNLNFGNLMAVTETRDGGFLSAGCRGTTDCNIFVAKYNSAGDTVWTKMWGSSFSDAANAVLQVSDSCYLVAGRYGYAEPNSWIAAYLAKLRESSLSSSQPQIALPIKFELAAFPNPFNPSTTLSLTLPKTGSVRLAIYDILGREVKLLQEGVVEAGEHAVTFDGSHLSSGIYFARLESAGLVKTQKLLLLK